MAGPTFIFAGGGTGGHLYPGLAVAEQLRQMLPDAHLIFACSDRAIDRQILEPTGHMFVPQPIKPMPRRLGGQIAFLRGYLAARAQARQMVRDLRPAAVLGLGGFAAEPLVNAASSAGLPTAMLNPDAVPGLANRMLGRRADVIFTQFASTAACFGPRLAGKVQCVGCPIRSGIAGGSRDEAVEFFGLQADKKTLLVVGGSSGAASVNAAIEALGDEFDEFPTWQVLHVAGPGEAKRSADKRRRRLDYCYRMDLAWAVADLAVTRGGAVTIAELAATGTPAVIMPYPHHKDRQQELNARELVAAGAAIVVQDGVDASVNVPRLRDTLLRVMGRPDRLAEMTEAAAKLTGRDDAADVVAGWMQRQSSAANARGAMAGIATH